MRTRALLLAILLFGCASAPPVESDVSVTRAEVSTALQRQFELVLARRNALSASHDKADAAERRELDHLAAQILADLVRIDPKGRIDLRTLVRRLDTGS